MSRVKYYYINCDQCGNVRKEGERLHQLASDRRDAAKEKVNARTT